ncbi:MAG: hypothetical protein A2X36_13995 [Elusimicrobia bacterium GWA2_69_24]|nr:MAG: hypothetical protein A2X36_13995 [Elusimicrobia bacterium GWA2_69_24]HBL16687.1 hypothetical protein [Elusimicrobiota bacterium]
MILFSYFLSGFAALLYEVLWVRLVTLFCGHTALAASAVLSAFMGGLALGSLLGGRLADRRDPGRLLRLYAALEAGVGSAALLTLPALHLVGKFLLWAGILSLPAPVRALSYFLLATAALLLPTALMGATLPLLTRWRSLRETGRADRPLSLLYGINTLGAVLGAASVGFLLLPALGTLRSMLCGAAASALSAALALRAARQEDILLRGPCRSIASGAARSTALTAAPAAPLPGARRAWLLLAVSGAAAMVCEVAWTRAFAVVLGSTVYAFTTVLVAVLLGLAAGSFAFHLLRARRDPSWGGLAVLLALLGASVYAGSYAFDRLPFLLTRLPALLPSAGGSPLLPQFLLTAAVLAVPTALMGAVFPWAVAALSPAREDIGRAAGSCYAANTLGAILGSATAGLILLPALDLERTLLAAVWAYAGASILCVCALPASGRVKAAGSAVLLAACGALAALRPSWNTRLFTSGMFVYGPYFAKSGMDFRTFRRVLERDQVIFHRSGRNASVTVLENPDGERYLRVNGKTDASDGGDIDTQLLLGYLPLLLHPGAPRDALVVGLGAGLTASALASDPGLGALDVVEIEPVVAEAAGLFARSNRGVLRDPRLRLHSADARQFLAAAAATGGPRWDLIASEPSNPWISGVAYLYTREAFALYRGRLKDGGVFAQWFHAYSMTEEDFRLVVRTFTSVFPHALLLSNGRADYFLLGSNAPWDIDYGLIQRRFAANATLRGDLAHLGEGYDHPFTLLTSTLILSDADLRRFCAGAPVQTDDRPTLEFSAARSIGLLRAKAIADLLRGFKTLPLPEGLRGLSITDKERGLIFNKTARVLLDAGRGDRAEAVVARALSYDPASARAWTSQGRIWELRGRKDHAMASFRKAVALDPREPEARARLGALLERSGRRREALAQLEPARALSPKDPLTGLELARIYASQMRVPEARALLESVLAQPVPRSALRRDLIRLLRSAGGDLR